MHTSFFYAQSPDFHKLGDWKQSSKQDSLACQGRDNRDNFSAVKSQFQFTDSVANNLLIALSYPTNSQVRLLWIYWYSEIRAHHSINHYISVIYI